MSWLFTPRGQSMGASTSTSVLPVNIQDLISFRIDWLDLLAVQGTLKSLLQHHSSKTSIFQQSTFFTVQLSHPYMTTGKTTALTRWTSVGKVMSLLFNMLSSGPIGLAKSDVGHCLRVLRQAEPISRVEKIREGTGKIPPGSWKGERFCVNWYPLKGTPAHQFHDLAT